MARCFAFGAVRTASRRGEAPAFVEQLPWAGVQQRIAPVVEGGKNVRTRTGPLQRHWRGPYRRSGRPLVSRPDGPRRPDPVGHPYCRNTKDTTVRRLILYMTTTVDGFIAGPNNALDWMLGTSDPGFNDGIVALLRASDAGFLGYPVGLID